MATKEASPALRAQQVKIIGVVAAYFFVSISLVFLNKVLMDKRTSVEAPLFMTWFQCAVTVAICWSLGVAGERSEAGSWYKQFPAFRYDLAVARKLLPLSLVFVGMITFNNLCLQLVEVSFYNVARSLTIVFNVIFTYTMLGETTSSRTIACLAVVVVGFFTGSGSEVNFSLVGTLFGVASSVFVSLNSIQTKKAMPLVDGNQWKLLAYNNMNACVLFVPIILLSSERTILMENMHVLLTPWYWFVMCAGAAFGFLIGLVTVLQIKLTSPLTHNISGTAKACVQTVLALVIWQNETNVANMLGVALVLFGSAAYTYVRNEEMAQASVRKEAAKAVRDEEAAQPVEHAVGASEAPSSSDERK